MDSIIEDTIGDDEIARLAKLHAESKESGGEVESQARFNYAYGLLKSRHKDDIKRGISMLENLFQEGDSTTRRDSLYYVAIGHTRLKNYQQGLDCVDAFLRHEPNNNQARNLKDEIKHRLQRDALKGAGMAAGAAIAIGGALALAFSLAKK